MELFKGGSFDSSNLASIRLAATELSLNNVLQNYINNKGSDTIIPTVSDLNALGYSDVSSENIDAVLSFLSVALERSLSAEQAIDSAVTKQLDAMSSILAWDGSGTAQFDNGASFTASGNPGTATSSSQWDNSTHKVANAFDGNDSTYWASNKAISLTSPEILTWQSNDTNYRGTLDRVELNPRDAFNNRVPINFDVEVIY